MMDRNFGFGRFGPQAAASMAFSAPAVTTALAEELFTPRRTSDWRAPKTPCSVQGKQRPTYEVAAAEAAAA
jgi:hypothetical protein